LRREFSRLNKPSSPMQSPDPSQSYFELFGLEPSFDVDRASLQAEQRSLQARYHPDRHVNASDRDKRLSIQVASWINQAFETLQDPVKRARYLLEISDVALPDDSATTSDSEFLMEQLELREAVESCRDHADGLGHSEKIALKLEQRASELAGDFVSAYDASDFDKAMQAHQKMQFIQRIQQQLSELQFELEGR